LESEVIIVSGDFTQRAKREQFADARAFLNQLPDCPTVVIPGNHDVPLYRVFERIFSPYALYKEYISKDLDMVLRSEEAVIVALNSTKPLRAIVNGRIARWQLKFCEEAFREAPEDALRIVVAHHHFAPAPDYEGGQVMPKAKRAIDCFTDLKVDMVIGGHLHRAYIGNSLDVYPGEDRDHGIIIVQSGTSTSRRGRAREREKNSFNHIRIAEGVVRITHYIYFTDLDGFAPVSRHLFPRAGTHYLREVLGTH
jgi:3',5'-cyclic AMP phosphodiesterase CpdA